MRKFNITVNGTTYEVEVEEVTGEQPAAPAAPVQKPAAAQEKAPAQQTSAPVSGTKITAPMPGVVLDIKASQGAAIRKGDVILVLEAMKMENEIVAPQDGTLAQILVAKSASVNSGDVLCVIQ